MVVGIVACEVHLPQARSLKQKRQVIKSLVERVHQRYRVSVAETDFHDLHQRSEIGLAVVSRGPAEVESLLDQLRQLFELEDRLYITSWQTEILTDPGRPDFGAFDFE
ncbi:MAG: DUF503 domain-containing protein [Acidobacteriota bacterium]